MQVFTFAVVSFAVILAASALPQYVPQYLPHNDFFSETHECVPETQFIDICNRCYCAPNGKSAVCTKILCPAPEKPVIDGYKDGFSCLPGKTFYDGYEECVCNKAGNAAECSAVKDLSIDNYVQGNKCPAGKSFYDKCNTCRCSADGLSAACTRAECPEFE